MSLTPEQRQKIHAALRKNGVDVVRDDGAIFTLVSEMLAEAWDQGLRRSILSDTSGNPYREAAR